MYGICIILTNYYAYFAYKIKSSEVENHGYEVFFIKNDSLNIFLKDNEFNNEFEPALVD